MVAGGTCPRLLGGLPDDLRDDIAFEESDARTERVILVDDDSSVRRATQQILEYLGFEVQAYPDGQTAFQAIAQDRRPISLLVTDYNMPGLTGYELAQLVRTQRPGVPILIASGADEDSILAEVDPSEMPPFIQKPYSLNSLATKVREILDLARTESPSLLAG
jgi:CheY-like chemotaxis protein